MSIVTHDTQHGVTIALSVNSLTLRITSVAPAKSTIPAVESTHHATTGDATMVVGDIEALAPISITYQNNSQLANPTKVVQTLTITGPTPAGASTGEIMSITGFVTETEESPQYDTATGTAAALQMKTFVFQPDGTTFTHTVSAT